MTEGKIRYKLNKNVRGRGTHVIDAYIGSVWVFQFDAYLSRGGYVYSLYPRLKGNPYGPDISKPHKVSVMEVEM